MIQASKVIGPYSISRLLSGDSLFEKETTLVLGTFDGVHKGHQALISEAKKVNGTDQSKIVVFTFNQIPKQVVSPQADIKFLLTSQRKSQLLLAFGADLVVFANFDTEFAQVEPTVFLEEILVHSLKAKRIVVGYNYTFGRGGLGNIITLQEHASKLGVKVIVVPPQMVDGEEVSSTLIRKLLSLGECERATKLLGLPYALEGTVVKGEQIGTKLGFPTANLEVIDDLLIPKDGVYLTYVRHLSGEPLGFAATSIGSRLTLNLEEKTIESHILEFSGDLYLKPLRVEFLQYLRPMQWFSSIKELQDQIAQDINRVKDISGKLKHKHANIR